jgi:hypothetical protein
LLTLRLMILGLLERSVPPFIICFIIAVYSHQVAYVRWSWCLFDSSVVYRQAGVSSPILFCVYVDGLLMRLKEAKLGCYVGSEQWRTK